MMKFWGFKSSIFDASPRPWIYGDPIKDQLHLDAQINLVVSSWKTFHWRVKKIRILSKYPNKKRNFEVCCIRSTKKIPNYLNVCTIKKILLNGLALPAMGIKADWASQLSKLCANINCLGVNCVKTIFALSIQYVIRYVFE